MDADQARELAVTEFSDRIARSGQAWRPADWRISGPVEGQVTTPRGVRSQLIFEFVERDAAAGQRPFPLRIAVDPETGETDMLR